MLNLWAASLDGEPARVGGLARPASELAKDILNQLTQVFVDVTPIRVEPLGNVLQRLEEAVEIHLGVLAAAHYVLVDDVVVRLGDVVIGHVCELGQPLELTRGDEIVVLLPSEVLENGLSL